MLGLLVGLLNTDEVGCERLLFCQARRFSTDLLKAQYYELERLQGYCTILPYRVDLPLSDYNDSIVNLRFHRFTEGAEASQTEAEDHTEAHTEETENINEDRPDETTVDNMDSCQRLEDTNCPSEEQESTERALECNTQEKETRDGT